MNIYTMTAITNVAIVAGSVAICFASKSAWGLLGFICLTFFSYEKPKDKGQGK